MDGDTKFWLKTAILMGEALLGMVAKGTIAVAILNLIFIQRKLNASCVYMLDKTIGDFLFLITWTISAILEHFHSTTDNNGIGVNDINNGTTSLSPLCPSTFLLPLKIFNIITFVHSVAILSFMSVERCRSIVRPFYYLNSTWSSWKRAFLNVTLLWTLSGVVGACIQCCYTFLMCGTERHLAVGLQTAFTVATYLIPLAIIFGSYFVAIGKLRKSIRSDQMLKNDVMMKKRKSLAKKMLFLVAIFALCWLAFNVAAVAKYAVEPEQRKNPVLEWFTFVAYVVAFTNFTLNPLALMFFNETILNSLKCCRRQRQQQHSYNITQRPSVSIGVSDNMQIYPGMGSKVRSASVETVRTDLLEE